MRRSSFLPVALAAVLCAVGCGRPNRANIELRKQNAALEQQVRELKKARHADQLRMQALESRATTVPVLPNDQLEKLFTVHDLRLGKLTGGADLDLNTPGDEALKVYVTPVDRHGQDLKAAGALTVELFDLSLADDQRIGQWQFPLDEARKNWIGAGLIYSYVLTCPWQQRPVHSDLLVKVSFTDELTGRTFQAHKAVTVALPQP